MEKCVRERMERQRRRKEGERAAETVDTAEGENKKMVFRIVGGVRVVGAMVP